MSNVIKVDFRKKSITSHSNDVERKWVEPIKFPDNLDGSPYLAADGPLDEGFIKLAYDPGSEDPTPPNAA